MTDQVNPSLADPPDPDDLKKWQEELAAARHTVLTDVRATAGKWQAAIAGVLGTFATASFIWGPDKLKDFPLSGKAEAAALGLLGLAGLAGLAAGTLGTFAASGFPSVEHLSPSQFHDGVVKQTGRSVTALQWTMALAGIATALVIGVSGWVLCAAATADSPPSKLYAVIRTNQGYACGQLASMGPTGKLKLIKVDNGKGKSIEVPRTAALRIVDSCAG